MFDLSGTVIDRNLSLTVALDAIRFVLSLLFDDFSPYFFSLILILINGNPSDQIVFILFPLKMKDVGNSAFVCPNDRQLQLRAK